MDCCPQEYIILIPCYPPKHAFSTHHGSHVLGLLLQEKIFCPLHGSPVARVLPFLCLQVLQTCSCSPVFRFSRLSGLQVSRVQALLLSGSSASRLSCFQVLKSPGFDTSRFFCLSSGPAVGYPALKYIGTLAVLPTGLQDLLPPGYPALKYCDFLAHLPPDSAASRLSFLQALLPPGSAASRLSLLLALLPSGSLLPGSPASTLPAFRLPASRLSYLQALLPPNCSVSMVSCPQAF